MNAPAPTSTGPGPARAGVTRPRRRALLMLLLGPALVAALVASAPSGPEPADPAPADPEGSTAQTRLDLAREAIGHLDHGIEQGVVAPDVDDLLRWHRRLYEAQLDLARDRAGRIAAAEAFDAFARDRLGVVEKLHREGDRSLIDLLDARHACAEVDEILFRARRGD